MNNIAYFFMLRTLFNLPDIQNIQNKFDKMYKASFFECCKAINPDGVLEIGAHEAELSRKMRNSYPDIKIIAYEGNPYIYQFMNNKFDFKQADINYINELVSDQTGKIEFNAPYIPDTGAYGAPKGIGSILQSSYFKCDYKRIGVNSTTLDTIIEQNGPFQKVCMQIDVEGATEQVLAGGPKVFEEGIVALINVELNTKEIWEGQSLDYRIFEILSEYDFTLLFSNFESVNKYDACFINKKLINTRILQIVSEYYDEYKYIIGVEKHSELYNMFLIRFGSEPIISGKKLLIRRSTNRGAPFAMGVYIDGIDKRLHYEVKIERHSSDIINICLHNEIKSDDIINNFRSGLQSSWDSIISIVSDDIKSMENAPDKYGFRVTLPYTIAAGEIYCEILLKIIRGTIDNIIKFRESLSN